MMKCIIVDDEPLARKGMMNYVSEVPFLEQKGTANNGVELSVLLGEKAVDLVFLDIQMPKMNGIEFLKVVKNPPMVIITSAYPNYALESFEYDVVDYLLKPVTFERFFQACKKAHELHKLSISEQSDDSYFFIKCEGMFEKVFKEEILYIKGMQNYVTIFTETRKLTTLIYMKDIAELLGAVNFVRTHKSYLVAKKKVTQIRGNEILLGDINIPISRHYREKVLAVVVGDKLWKR